MRRRHYSLRMVGASAGLSLTMLSACERSEPTTPSGVVWALASAGQPTARNLSVAVCSPSAGFTTVFTHPYFPAPVGRQWILEGEERGEDIRLQITVLNLLRTIGGVITRVIEEREWVDGVLLEVSWNYYAQASDGTICYHGEDVDIYESGGIVHDGRWCASTTGSHAGIFLPADPQPGMKFQMEVAPGVAVDEGQIVGIGPLTVPLARYDETIRVRDFNPLDGSKGYKAYANGVGLILDGPVELTALHQTSGTPGQPTLTSQVCGT